MYNALNNRILVIRTHNLGTPHLRTSSSACKARAKCSFAHMQFQNLRHFPNAEPQTVKPEMLNLALKRTV